MMTVFDLIVGRRSIRRFEQRPVGAEVLDRCIEAARLAPSGSNLQPLEYLVVEDPEVCERVFPQTAWAGYLEDGEPPPSLRPTAYVFILVNTNIRPSADKDVGIAAENITLAALEAGVGSCMLGSLKKEHLRDILNIPADRTIALAVALGFPAESPVAEEMRAGREGSAHEYYRDEDDVLHVPKRRKRDILHKNRYGSR
jgi:nitroreductase